MVAIPNYLLECYDWAYVTPKAVQRFERQWLVNLILWGNFARLRDAAVAALAGAPPGRTLQVACVYGDLTARLLAALPASDALSVIDVLPVQLDNLRAKLGEDAERVHIHHGDSAAMPFGTASYDRALLFFLLHEQPEDVRRKTLAETFRVLRPGGKLVIVDYHRPHALHPLRLPMRGVLQTLEPFALDLWRHDITQWFPPDLEVQQLSRRTLFGGLYQLIEITK